VAAAFVVLWGTNLISIGVSRDAFYSEAEGPGLAVPRFLLLAGSFTGITTYCAAPDLMDWSVLRLPSPIRWTGFLLGAAALVVHGPYRRIRHPMYTAFVLLWLGYLLLSANWFIGLSGIAAFLLTMVVRNPHEERMMIDRFGLEYVNYMKTTGRYVPLRRTAGRAKNGTT
jgi:protein-S-isoprenylcysteine O-methyltransferase Ste14